MRLTITGATLGRCRVILLLWFAAMGPVVMAQTQFSVQPDTSQPRVVVLANGRPFTTYVYPTSLKKPVLYPLHAPSGAVVTRGFPLEPRPNERIDHPHHVGLWFNYGDVNGYDFWNNSPAVDPAGRYGTIRHRQVVSTLGGKRGELRITADWITSDGNRVLKEDTKFVFSTWNNHTYLIDRYTTLTAVNGDVSFRDNKEGMLGIRVARALEHPTDEPAVFTDASGISTEVAVLSNDGVNGHYYSSEGTEGAAVWGTRARWMQLSGRVDELPTSLVIIDHPDNVGFPTYWHARGYGLFAANPLGQKALSGGKEELNFSLQDGESTIFRYRVAVHSGELLSNTVVREMFDQFAKEP